MSQLLDLENFCPIFTLRSRQVADGLSTPPCPSNADVITRSKVTRETFHFAVGTDVVRTDLVLTARLPVPAGCLPVEKATTSRCRRSPSTPSYSLIHSTDASFQEEYLCRCRRLLLDDLVLAAPLAGPAGRRPPAAMAATSATSSMPIRECKVSLDSPQRLLCRPRGGTSPTVANRRPSARSQFTVSSHVYIYSSVK